MKKKHDSLLTVHSGCRTVLGTKGCPGPGVYIRGVSKLMRARESQRNIKISPGKCQYVIATPTLQSFSQRCRVTFMTVAHTQAAHAH